MGSCLLGAALLVWRQNVPRSSQTPDSCLLPGCCQAPRLRWSSDTALFVSLSVFLPLLEVSGFTDSETWSLGCLKQGNCNHSWRLSPLSQGSKFWCKARQKKLYSICIGTHIHLYSFKSSISMQMYKVQIVGKYA